MQLSAFLSIYDLLASTGRLFAKFYIMCFCIMHLPTWEKSSKYDLGLY